MPWCPKCNIEYKEGVKTCADCGTALTEEMQEKQELVLIITLTEEENAKRFVSFLEQEDMTAVLNYSEEDAGYVVMTPEKMAKQAKKCAKAFTEVELELKETAELSKRREEQSAIALTQEEVDEMMEEDTSEEEAEHYAREKSASLTNSPSTTYIKKSEKSKDLQSTAVTFLLFGFLGVIFLGLNIAGILTFYNSILSYVVMSALFLFFLIVGFSSLKKAKALKGEAVSEDELTAKLNAWLSSNITDTVLSTYEDSSLNNELNFLKKIEGIKSLVVKEFGSLDESFLDSIVEDFYNETFEEAN